MIDINSISSLADEWRQTGRHSTMAEFIYELYKDQYVEIYLGDSYEDVSLEQISSSYPAVFCGKIISAFKECLAIQCIHVSKQKTVVEGNVLFISERAIRALSPVDQTCTVQDMILRSNEINAIYNAFINKTSIKIKK